MLSVNDPRPLAQVIVNFERAYGFAVTYEDPRFVHPSDLVEREYRGAHDLIPRGGPFSAMFDPPTPDSTQDAVAAAITSIVGQYNASGYPAQFRVVVTEDIVHVVPSSVRDTNGELAATSSILDGRISVPAAAGQNLYQGLRGILDTVEKSAGQTVEIGTVPTNLLMQSPMKVDALAAPARDVIAAALRSSGRALSWRLLYGASRKRYVFNVHLVNGIRK
jgi:hypothetical protein